MQVCVIAGSKNDKKFVEETLKVLEDFGVEYEFRVLSAHRTPEALIDYIKLAESKGAKVFIALAGYSAHLAGVIASHTVLPVIGVPLATSVLSGVDSLFSTVQMPSGVPVATVAVNGAKNAALLAVSILAVENKDLKKKLETFRAKLAEGVIEGDRG